MTFEEAAQLFIEVANEAILRNERLSHLMRQLYAEGIHVGGVAIEVFMQRAADQAQQTDADFLKQLRIVPDISVEQQDDRGC
jgi:hypothetical protein